MRHAVCNELFGETSFADSIVMLAGAGFQGVEIAPHTLFGDFTGPADRTLAEVRRILDGEGVRFAGFHWLLVGPPDLHATDPDPAIRGRAWDHIRRLADMAGELGGAPMTLGSPAQRSSRGGIDAREARRHFVAGLESVAAGVAAAGCRLLVEALPGEFTDVVNTLEEAREVIDGIGHPGIGGMFDFHNTDDETEAWPGLIRAHAAHTDHIHLNDTGGTAPKAADERFRAAFAAIRESGYRGWISLEIFTVPPDPLSLLEGVADFLEAVEDKE